jgi:hypothetical protein
MKGVSLTNLEIRIPADNRDNFTTIFVLDERIFIEGIIEYIPGMNDVYWIKSDADPAFWGNLVHLNMTTDDKILWLLDSKMPQRMAHQLYMLRLRMSHAVMKALDKAQKGFFRTTEMIHCSIEHFKIVEKLLQSTCLAIKQARSSTKETRGILRNQQYTRTTIEHNLRRVIFNRTGVAQILIDVVVVLFYSFQ